MGANSGNHSEAAKSLRGIWALAIFAPSMIGFVFLRRHELPIKIRIFVLMFLSFGLSGCTTPPLEPASVEAKQETKSEPKTVTIGHITWPIADFHRLSNRHELARTAYKEDRAFYRQEQNHLAEAYVLLRLGDMELTLGRYDQAREALGAARTLFKQVGSRRGEASMLESLGLLESKLQRNEQAREAYGAARTLYKQAGDRLGEATMLRRLGLLERTIGHNKRAKEYFNKAAHLYGTVGREDWKEWALRNAKALDD